MGIRGQATAGMAAADRVIARLVAITVEGAQAHRAAVVTLLAEVVAMLAAAVGTPAAVVDTPAAAAEVTEAGAIDKELCRDCKLLYLK